MWKNFWLQLLFYDRKRAIPRMDSCNWRRINSISLKTKMVQVLTLKKDSTHENNRSRQVAPWNNGGTTQMHGCMCSFEVTIRLKWKYLSKHCLYTIHGCKCCSEINTVSYKEWMTATNFVKKKKYCTLEKIVKH